MQRILKDVEAMKLLEASILSYAYIYIEKEKKKENKKIRILLILVCIIEEKKVCVLNSFLLHDKWSLNR